MSPSPAAANRSEVGGPLPGLGADLLAVVARLNRLATQRIQMPLPAAQARLLATIEAQGEARIGDLAAVDHCSQPTMTTQVRRLEDAGLVTRTADPGDARAVRIRITPEGIRTLTAVRADRAAAIEPQLALLPPADRRVLADAVDAGCSTMPPPRRAGRRGNRHRDVERRAVGGVGRIDAPENAKGIAWRLLLLELSGPSRLLRKANASRLIDGERQLGPKRPAFHYYQCASIVVG